MKKVIRINETAKQAIWEYAANYVSRYEPKDFTVADEYVGITALIKAGKLNMYKCTFEEIRGYALETYGGYLITSFEYGVRPDGITKY